MDLSNLDQVRAVVRDVRPTLIVNPAAYTAVDKAETGESMLAMRINGEAPGVLAEEAEKLGAALIHYSTDYVFNGAKDGAYVEDDPTDPQNVYGRSKLAGEQAIMASGCASSGFAYELGVWHARQEFSAHHAAAGRRATGHESRRRSDRRAHLVQHYCNFDCSHCGPEPFGRGSHPMVAGLLRHFPFDVRWGNILVWIC